MMPFELQRYAAAHFSEVADRKQRIHQAECALVRRFFGSAPPESRELRAEGEEPDRAAVVPSRPLAPGPSPLVPGYFVEVGANDPRQSSQTWHLEQAGWRGVLIEPVPELCSRLRDERPHSTVVQAACSAPNSTGETDFYVKSGFAQSTLAPERLNLASDVIDVIKVKVTTLDQILVTARLPRVDFVSIDVEGLQLEVLQGFTLSIHRPKLLLVEDHLGDLATHRHIVSQGYKLVKRTARNNWYIPAGAPFELTSSGERLLLWKQLWLSTPVRKMKSLRRSAMPKAA